MFARGKRRTDLTTKSTEDMKDGMDCGYRVDVLVEDALILDLKSVEEIKGIHEAQLRKASARTCASWKGRSRNRPFPHARDRSVTGRQ